MQMTYLAKPSLRGFQSGKTSEEVGMAEEDEDVVLAGSALHQHLLDSGLGDVELSSPASSDRSGCCPCHLSLVISHL